MEPHIEEFIDAVIKLAKGEDADLPDQLPDSWEDDVWGDDDAKEHFSKAAEDDKMLLHRFMSALYENKDKAEPLTAACKDEDVLGEVDQVTEGLVDLGCAVLKKLVPGNEFEIDREAIRVS